MGQRKQDALLSREKHKARNFLHLAELTRTDTPPPPTVSLNETPRRCSTQLAEQGHFLNTHVAKIKQKCRLTG